MPIVKEELISVLSEMKAIYVADPVIAVRSKNMKHGMHMVDHKD